MLLGLSGLHNHHIGGSLLLGRGGVVTLLGRGIVTLLGRWVALLGRWVAWSWCVTRGLLVGHLDCGPLLTAN